MGILSSLTSALIAFNPEKKISLNKKTSTNSDGDEQKALDVYADESYLDEFKNSPVKFRLYYSFIYKKIPQKI